MTAGFAVLLILALGMLGRDGRKLPLYGLAGAVAAGLSAGGGLALTACAVLIGVNLAAWVLLRPFTLYENDRAAFRRGSVLPVVATLLLQMALALPASGLGLAAVLGTGSVLAGLCGVACGPPLAQFVGLLVAADGLIVMACVLQSWALLGTGAALWAVLGVLGVVLLPRLAWRRVEEAG